MTGERLAGRSLGTGLPAFLRFSPVPVRARHDGWSPALQRRFILLLATGCPAGEAARRLGRGRQAAYALRRLPGGEGFAAAWDSALAFAHEARTATHGVPTLDEGFDRIWVPRFYRGRLVGFVERDDHNSALRTLARLDRLAETIDHEPAAGFDLDAYLESLGAPAEADKADKMHV